MKRRRLIVGAGSLLPAVGGCLGSGETSREPLFSEPYPGHGTPFDITLVNPTEEATTVSLRISVDGKAVYSSDYVIPANGREEDRYEPETVESHEFRITVGDVNQSEVFDPREFKAVWISYDGGLVIEGMP